MKNKKDSKQKENNQDNIDKMKAFVKSKKEENELLKKIVDKLTSRKINK